MTALSQILSSRRAVVDAADVSGLGTAATTATTDYATAAQGATADTAYQSSDLASQAQAETGTNNTTLMTPLRTAEAIAALASSPSWLLKSTAYTASPGDRIAADVSGSAWTLTLPASPVAGDFIDLAVIDGDASVNNLTISGNGNNIQGDTTLVMDLSLSPVDVSLIYNNTEWRIA